MPPRNLPHLPHPPSPPHLPHPPSLPHLPMVNNNLNSALSTFNFDTTDRLQNLAIKPLAVIISASGQDNVTPGSTFHLSMMVTNKGNQSAVIEVYIQEESKGLRQWCKSGQKLLALGSDRSEEVIFEFDIPIDTLPGLYNYIVVVDAPDDYPEYTPIQYQQYLQIVPATADIINSSDPTFISYPTTSPDSPSIIQPGGALAVQILVQNRGDRVDKFRLICTDLPKNWVNITYPQVFQGTGLIIETDCLNLNPGENGQISLLINPPISTLAGKYIPTMRLHSENNPELKLLDLLYLEVAPTYQLQTELRSIISRVKSKTGIYQLRLTNTGNTPRKINVKVQELEENHICNYTLEQSQALILPQQTVAVDLQIKPKNRWQRPFIGGPRIVNFNIDLFDHQELPLAPNNFPGMLLWEARPWWQILPLILLMLLCLGTSAYFIWWFLFRIPPSPKIWQFYPEDSAYAAINADTVSLGFEISDINRLKSLKIVGISADGKPLTRPQEYDFSQGVPATLQSFCTQQKNLLNCRNVRTGARKPGTYIFEMSTQPKPGRGAATDNIKTNPVAIAPIPQPEIIAFGSTQPTYQEFSLLNPNQKEAKNNPKSLNKDFQIRLNWAIRNASQLRMVQLIGRTPDGLAVTPVKNFDFSQGIPSQLKKFCAAGEPLVCFNMTTNLKKPGDYIFELKAISQDSENQKLEPSKTELIKIIPKPPQIISFKINGKPAPTKLMVPITPGKPVPKIVLSWEIDASEGTKVELQPAPGTVRLKDSISFPLEPKPASIPISLQVTTTTGQQIVRSLILETYDPKAKDPAIVAAEKMAEAISKSQKEAAESAQADQKEAAAKAANTEKNTPANAANINAAPGSVPEDEEDNTKSKNPPTLLPIPLPPQ
ncbi:hypothetical protein [Calothrix sp. PCC 6303]